MTMARRGSTGSSSLLLLALLHSAVVQAFVFRPPTPKLVLPSVGPATPTRPSHSSLLLLRRPSAVGDGDKDDSESSDRRQRQLMEDTLFSLETRAQQLAREVGG